VWSSDAKPLEQFSVSEDVSRVVYVPFTHTYWQMNHNGNINAFDARAPALVSEFVAESNNLEGKHVTNLWVPPHSDSLFVATEEQGIVQYRHVRCCFTANNLKKIFLMEDPVRKLGDRMSLRHACLKLAEIL
jgi:hypothetical protein